MQNVLGKTMACSRLRYEHFGLKSGYLITIGILQSRLFSARGQTKGASNYYDVLALTPKATQSQIKASYFQLSKLYHPDVNKSIEAKAKFAELSEAYETLGNIQRRRIYDRTFLNPSGTRGHYQTPEPFQDMEAFRRRDSPPRGRTKAYNFDEFYRQHYEDYHRQTQKDKEFIRKQQLEHESKQGDVARGIFFVGVLMGMTLAVWPFRNKYKHQGKKS